MTVFLFSCGSIFAGNVYSADALDEAQAAIQEWVRVEQMVSQERRQWREEKAAIENMLTILAAEREALNGQISRAEEVASRADEERASLVAQLSDYEATSETLEAQVADYERQLILLKDYLPPVLHSELEPRYARVEGVATSLNLSLSERAQAVFSLMADINNFDSQLTLTTEILEQVQSQPLEARVLYFGLARAFYVNDNRTVSGFGVPTANGWSWTAANERAPDIARAMDIYETRTSPQLVELPMEIDQ